MSLTIDVWITPDLALLLCPEPAGPDDREFMNQIWPLFQQHTDYISEHKFRWAISSELVETILRSDEYPWSALPTAPWLMTLYTDISLRLRGTMRPMGAPSRTYDLVPALFPEYSLPTTDDVWLQMVGWCHEQHRSQIYIASAPQHHPGVNPVAIRYRGDMSDRGLLKLIPQHLDYEDLREDVDPWYKAWLPDNGEFPYEPPPNWMPGQPFPGQMTPHGRGYVDAHRQVWVWDRVHNDHWDVQFNPPGAGRYRRVKPDGSLMPGKD